MAEYAAAQERRIMTAYEIISAGFALAGEDIDAWPDKKIAVSWLNISIAECIRAENLIRERTGRELWGSGEYVSDMADTVNMDEVLCRLCLPLAVASLLNTDRENESMAAEMRRRFSVTLKAAAGTLEKQVVDMYGGNV